MNILPNFSKFLIRAIPISVLLVAAPCAQAVIVQLKFDVVVDYEDDLLNGNNYCQTEPVDDFMCIPNVAVGDRTNVTFEIDTQSSRTPPDGYFEYWSVDPPPVWGSFGVWSTTIETRSGPFVPHSGDGDDWGGWPIIQLIDGPVDIFSIYSPTNHDWEGGGATNIELRDSTGTAISAADVATRSGFESWIFNRFDQTLFDSGDWYLSTYDGGGGAGGRIDVPEPTPFVLLMGGMLAAILVRRRRMLTV